MIYKIYKGSDIMHPDNLQGISDSRKNQFIFEGLVNIIDFLNHEEYGSVKYGYNDRILYGIGKNSKYSVKELLDIENIESISIEDGRVSIIFWQGGQNKFRLNMNRDRYWYDELEEED